MVTSVDDEGRATFPDEEIDHETAEVFRRLRAPFRDDQVVEREEDGRVFASVEWIDVQDRLNEVVGPDRWESKVQLVGQSAVCHVTLYLPSGRALTRGAVGHAGPSTKDSITYMGADSIAFKRACVRFGVAAYLYRGEPESAPGPARRPAERREDRDDDRRPGNGHAKERREYQGGYKPDGERRNGGDRDRPRSERIRDRSGRENWRRNGQPPRTGAALVAWVRGQQEENQAAEGLEKHIGKWAKDEGLHWKWAEWTEDDVRLAYEEAQAFIHGAE